MLLAKPTSPVSAVAKPSAAFGAILKTIWIMPRPSSSLVVLVRSSWRMNVGVVLTVLPEPGRSPLATSMAAVPVVFAAKELEMQPICMFWPWRSRVAAAL